MRMTGFDCMKCSGIGTYGVSSEGYGFPRCVFWRCSACGARLMKFESSDFDGVPLPESLVTWLAGGLCCQRPHVPPADTGWIVYGPRFSLSGPSYYDEDDMVSHLTGGAP